jgi:hypothetical protein
VDEHTIVGAPLTVARTTDIPLTEVSGLTIHRDAGGEVLLAIGDHNGRLARTRLTPVQPGPVGGWDVVDLSAMGAAGDIPLAQIEAVCADGSGRLVLMQEEPPRIVVVDPGDNSLVAVLALDAGTDAFLASVWDRDENSRGEAMVLLPGGRVFVAKEKRPICFAVFGPQPPGAPQSPPDLGDGSGADPKLGVHRAERTALEPWGALPSAAAPGDSGSASGTLFALASWPAGKHIERLGDISDAALGPDGAVYLLSDQTASIARVDQLPPPGEKLRPSHTWQISGGPAKCEGLAFAADGTCFVGVDTRQPRDNLLTIPASAFGL